MYTIRINGETIYNPLAEEIWVASPVVELETNSAGSASLTLLKGAPYSAQPMDDIDVRDDGEIIFYGRITNVKTDLWGNQKISAEGALAFLNDSQIPPYTGSKKTSEILTDIVRLHNSSAGSTKREFVIGPTDLGDQTSDLISTDYKSGWELVKALTDATGATISPAITESGGKYTITLGYFLKALEANEQEVILGENLLSYEGENDTTEAYSVLIPTGKDGLTIETCADGSADGLTKTGVELIADAEVEKYGRIVRHVSFSDIEDASELLEAAKAEITASTAKLRNTITIKACDLHYADSRIESFRLNKATIIRIPARNISTAYILTKLSIDIANPQNTTITLNGGLVPSLVGSNGSSAATEADKVQRLEQDVSGLKNGQTAAGYAEKADKDGNGNTIADTYVTNQNLTTAVNTAIESAGLASSDDVTGAIEKALTWETRVLTFGTDLPDLATNKTLLGYMIYITQVKQIHSVIGGAPIEHPELMFYASEDGSKNGTTPVFTRAEEDIVTLYFDFDRTNEKLPPYLIIKWLPK